MGIERKQEWGRGESKKAFREVPEKDKTLAVAAFMEDQIAAAGSDQRVSLSGEAFRI